MKLSEVTDWQGRVNRTLACVAAAKVTCRSLLPVSIHKSVTVYKKDQRAFRQSDMATKLELIAF